MIDLSKRTVLITGSTQGIGRAIAVGLAEAGARVVLHGLADDDRAREAVTACSQFGSQVALVTGDLADDLPNSVDRLIQQVSQTGMTVDCLVNNAGTYIDEPFLDMDFATFDRTMKLNVYAYFLLSQGFARQWVQAEISGRLLLIGSINGKLAEPVHVAYDTSKGAVAMMVRSLCVSLAPHQIRVNGLAPGLIETPLTADPIADPTFRRWMEHHTPNGRVPGPESCVGAARFLLSDEAEHVTGQMLYVDGGMSVWQQPDPPPEFRHREP